MAKSELWFKHHVDASEGNSLSLLFAEQDYEAIAFWWWLLEQIKKWNGAGDIGKATLSHSIIKRKLGWNRTRSAKVLLKIALTFKIEVNQISDDSFEVFIPNWLKFNETRGGKREPKIEQKRGRVESREYRVESAESDQLPMLSVDEHPLLTIWNSNCGTLARVKELGKGKRKKLACTRWKENPSTEYWTELVLRITRSKFCRGEVPGRDGAKPWKANFDWFVKPDTQIKISEGQYDDHGAADIGETVITNGALAE
jgi:hypothetical protein